MKVLKIRTWMTPQEAETVCHLLGELQEAICQEYGEEIQQMHRERLRQDEKKTQQQNDSPLFNDEIPF